VESYDPNCDAWTSISPMNKHRSAAGVISFDNHVYALGGHDGLSIFACVIFLMFENCVTHVFQKIIYHFYIFEFQVEMYNPQTGIWSNGVPMISKRCRYKSKCLEILLFYFKLSLTLTNDFRSAFFRLGVAVLDGLLYACGGYDGSTFLRSVEVYDPRIKKWNMIASMSVTRSRVALA
jgi:kelch-like protein 18